MSTRYKARPVPSDLNTTDGAALLREVMETLERLTVGPVDAPTNDASGSQDLEGSFVDGGIAVTQGLLPLSIQKAASFFTPLSTGGTITYIPPEPRNTIRSFTFPVPTTVTSGGNIKIAPDFVNSLPTDTLTLQCDGENWFELSRSLFAGTLPPGIVVGQMLYWDGTQWVPTSDVSFIPLNSFPFTVRKATTVQETANEAFNISDDLGNDYLKIDTVNGVVYFNNGTIIYNGNLLLNHATGLARVSVASSPFTVTADHVYLGVNTNAARTINLPAANSFSGGTARLLVVKDAVGTGALVNNITLARNGADTIEQVAANKVMNVTRMSLSLLSDGVSNWEIW
jgi:hypothetical protein